MMSDTMKVPTRAGNPGSTACLKARPALSCDIDSWEVFKLRVKRAV